MRVLHVLRQLNPGGIECWLNILIRNWSGPGAPEFHFALEERDFGLLAESFRRAGAKLHFCDPPRELVKATRSFSNLLCSAGPFEVVHCHNHHASAFHLALALRHGVNVRISHSHADFRFQRASNSRKAYQAASQWLLKHLANIKLAVGRGAARDLFGTAASSAQIIPCGADLLPLLSAVRNPDPLRFTLVHVGRLVPEKNQAFLIHILKHLLSKEPAARLWLVGEGPCRASLEALASRLGIARQVEFCGVRNDIPAILAKADAFVFPSYSEGLGLAALEAQVAGLPTLLASHLPKELDLFPASCRRLALNLPLDQWVSSLLEMRSLPILSSSKRSAMLAGSPFSIEANIRALRQIYAS